MILQNKGIQGKLKHDIMEINDGVFFDCFIENILRHEINFLYKNTIK
jgi:hypothetical protein